MPNNDRPGNGRGGPSISDGSGAGTQVSRRQFLKHAGVVGATSVLVPAILAPDPERSISAADAAGPLAPADDNHAWFHKGSINLTLKINGQDQTVTVEPRTTLLNTLRYYLDTPLTGTKPVCDHGQCGACTVDIDGKTAYSCMMLAVDAVGKKITTIEAVASSPDTLHPIQKEFVEHDGLMCGFCTPGFVMSVRACLAKNPTPTLDEVRHACSGNVCRCGTYPRVFEAAMAVAGAASEPAPAPAGPEAMAFTNTPQWPTAGLRYVIDKKIPRIDGPDKVTGRARYTHDVRLPGMLYGRVLPSPHASAHVATLDTSAAEAMPGVVSIVSWKDKTLHYQGDPVAAVAAETPEIAEDAIRAIAVTYGVKQHVVDTDTALDPDAPKVYPDGNVKTDKDFGDADAVTAALAKCAVVVEGEYRTPFQHHSALETHGVVVDYNGGPTATVYASTQGACSVSGDAANALGLDVSQVNCIVEHMGGGFGAKFGLDLPGSIACQLAVKAKRPVHLMLTRSDEFLMGGNRSGSWQKLKLGADKDGTLMALSAEQHRLGGLGDGSQAGQPWLYKIPTVHRTVDSIHMNIDSSRAFRAPGCPQSSFAIETLLDDLAAELDIDPLELRRKNVNSPDYDRQLDQGAEAIGWKEGRNPKPGAGQTGPKKRGMGVGLSQWGGGGYAACDVTVQISPDGGVDVSVGAQDLGTGTRTYVAAIVAERLALPIEAIRAHIGNSSFGNAVASGGSTTTASLAPAVLDAVEKAHKGLIERVASVFGIPNSPQSSPSNGEGAEPRLASYTGQTAEAPVRTASWISPTQIGWKQACAALGSTPVVAHGEWLPGLSDSGVHGAQFAHVEVDAETGKVRVLKLVGVQDCGLPLNRLAVESQINGGMILGLGYCLYEGKVTDKETGLMLNDNFEEYKVAGAVEIPECVPLIDDGDMRGVIGMAEPAAIPTASTIANAIFNACGVRVRTLPITPDKILDGLAELNKKGAAA
jgi:xanthine dehydrogenase YagR molybdenum-binding subunit